ncbi:probable methyltransferase PMT28 isoform X2 [Magnolia sinica]|uniref:probable methyltransferase PMT28 isoform X2 n=1 Tax=Magnolia sinica TaxID=86752 RepID=UPI00265B01C8|nr:probable methyltransferase PMT28 isoform X2 [Magnolia sinica]
MATVRFGRQGKRPYGFCAKVTLAVFLGLCFIVTWSVFSSPSSSVSSQRSSFSDISITVSGDPKGMDSGVVIGSVFRPKGTPGEGNKSIEEKKKGDPDVGGEDMKGIGDGGLQTKEGGRIDSVAHENGREKVNEDVVDPKKEVKHLKRGGLVAQNVTEVKDLDKETEGEGGGEEGEEEDDDQDIEIDGDVEGDADPNALADEERTEKMQDEIVSSKRTGKKKKIVGPLFDSRAHYTWKLCSVRSKHNYIPCIDVEGNIGRPQSYRHRERSCPKTPPMCLVSLPEGYGTPVPWPDSKSKILYRNVAHPKLAAFIKTQSWLNLSGDHLIFPQNQSEFKGGALHYIDSIEEMVPDIEWGKNIRLVLDIGCTDSGFGAALLDKEVLTLSLGLKDDQADLAQVALERGFPAVIGNLATRRLPFPGGVFDAIHCGECKMPWHSNGGKLLLEMNRILRPGGYFILSTKHENIEAEEAMSTLTASICWNILAHRTDEISEAGVKIYQKPASNDIYELRRKKNPALCKEDENPDAAWYAPIKTCLHKIPAAIEERGTEWPEEWPRRLETFPDWLSNRENLVAEAEHWKSIVNKSYLNGMGVDWSSVRNVLDMKAIHGGFAAALAPLKVWVMNVVPVHAPDTLPIIYERGLLGIYHDWCESFSSYPRSYDLLHADHLFSRLKNRVFRSYCWSQAWIDEDCIASGWQST